MKVLNGAVNVVHRPADIDGLGRMPCWGISAPTQPRWSRRGGVGGGGHPGYAHGVKYRFHKGHENMDILHKSLWRN